MRQVRTHFRNTILFGALGLGSLLGCKANKAAPCSESGQCLPGYACVDGVCIEAGPGTAMMMQRDAGNVGPMDSGAGPMSEGPDNVMVQGAEALSISRVKVDRDMLIALGIEPVSEVYRLQPDGLSFETDVSIQLPFSSTALPQGRSQSELWIYTAQDLEGPYEQRLPSALSDSHVEVDILRTGYFVLGLEMEVPPDPPQEDPPPELGEMPVEEAAFGRSCTSGSSACDISEPVCLTSDSGAAQCTGTCAYQSDCPSGHCCQDLLLDGDPQNMMCVPSGDCRSERFTMPAHRECAADADCVRGGRCVSGFCYSGAEQTAPLGAPCTQPTDCDPTLSDTCLIRLEDGGLASGAVSNYFGVADAVCAASCSSDSDCGQGCCRFAFTDSGAQEGFCVDGSVPGNCEAVTGPYSECDLFNPSTCDPSTTSGCIVAETEETEGVFCAPGCSADADCPGDAKCCELENYEGERYCLQGATACPQ